MQTNGTVEESYGMIFSQKDHFDGLRVQLKLPRVFALSFPLPKTAGQNLDVISCH